MNTTQLRPVLLKDLRISTKVRLHPDFLKAPLEFAREYGVNLVADVPPETTFKRDQHTHKKVSNLKANIHLMSYGAIRLFVTLKDDSVWIRSIDLSPAVLLHGAEDHLVTEAEFLRALTRLRIEVAPLLADQSDIPHLVPGLAGIAHWSGLTSEILLPDVLVPCLHHLSHPTTGPAEGRTLNRIQLGDEEDDYMIRLEKITSSVCSPEGSRKVEGTKATVKLEKRAVPATFGVVGTTVLIDETSRLTCFPIAAVTDALQTFTSKLEGTYLPIPREWQVGGSITLAKTIALLSAITPISAEELTATAKGLRKDSPRTNRRLDAPLLKELERLAPIPASELFTKSVYSPEVPCDIVQVMGPIDDDIAEAYGA